jgi:hypothetical protein
LRYRILLIIGAAVALLAVYTFFLRPRPTLQPVAADMRVVGERLQNSVAAKAPRAPAAAPAEKAPAPAPTPAPAAAAGDTTAAVASPLAPRAPESWGTDPFVRDWIMINELSNLSLKAVTMGGDRAYALINDQILEEGDQISGKRIAKIESDKVTLEQGGRTFTLLLGE